MNGRRSRRRSAAKSLPDKVCPHCGRTFSFRRKWADDWDEVVYCSQACRRGRLGATDRALEQAILELLAARGAGTTICPSEAARRVGGEDWRPLMERARRAARRLWSRGEATILQRGRALADPSKARGPIRVGAGRPDPAR
ncbi:MAG: DUF3253 domain-containing protein [Sandaracinaceae bacterium]